MRRPFVLAVATFLLLTGAVRAENWPEFRGLGGTGHAPGVLPTEWAAEKNVAWRQAIPGLGWSSPVVWDGRLYLTTAVPMEQAGVKTLSLRVVCVEAATGKILWNEEAIRKPATEVPGHHNKNSNASPSPIIDGKQLYVHFGHLGTACLDLTGKVIWKNLDLKYSPVHGNGGSPILVDDLLVFSIDGANKQGVVALERATGKLRWQTDRRSQATKKFAFSTPTLIEFAGQRQIISPGADVVTAHDPKTGDEIWRVKYNGYSVIPKPVFAHGLVFVSTSYDSPNFLAIRPDGKGDVTATHVAWTTNKNAPHTPSVLVVGDELYMVSDRGTASCLDAKTGKVHWSERVGGNYSASPLFADGKIYFQAEDGTTTLVKAGTTFQLLGKNELGERTLASYAVADGAIYLRSAEALYRIEKK